MLLLSSRWDARNAQTCVVHCLQSLLACYGFINSALHWIVCEARQLRHRPHVSDTAGVVYALIYIGILFTPLSHDLR